MKATSLMIVTLLLMTVSETNPLKPTQLQEMKENKPHIEGMTVAVTNMKPMLEFYTGVFEMKFEPIELYGSTLYSSRLDALKVLFCPAEVASNTAKQNRHQFDIIVQDLDNLMERALQFGGSLLGEVVEDDASKSVGIYDPDGNSILFKEMKSK